MLEAASRWGEASQDRDEIAAHTRGRLASGTDSHRAYKEAGVTRAAGARAQLFGKVWQVLECERVTRRPSDSAPAGGENTATQTRHPSSQRIPERQTDRPRERSPPVP